MQKMRRNSKRNLVLLIVTTALCMLNNARTVSSLVTPLALPRRGATISTALSSTITSNSSSDTKEKEDVGKDSVLPIQDRFGVYKIRTPDQHKALLESNMDKLVVIKHFAPWCKACKRK